MYQSRSKRLGSRDTKRDPSTQQNLTERRVSESAYSTADTKSVASQLDIPAPSSQTIEA